MVVLLRYAAQGPKVLLEVEVFLRKNFEGEIHLSRLRVRLDKVKRKNFVEG